MGMYTEVTIGCRFKKSAPRILIEALDYIINGIEIKDVKVGEFIIKYSLHIIQCDSYYFGAPATSAFYYNKIMNEYELSIRSNCKNYNYEIEKFIKYITPYVECGSGPLNIFATVQFESNDFPTLYGIDNVYTPYKNKNE